METQQSYKAIFSCVDIGKVFRQGDTSTGVLKGVTATFVQGSTYALTGVSGTGKSTLLHILACLEQPSSGDLYFNNKNITEFTLTQKQDFLLNSLGLIFQNAYLLPELTVIENVMLKGLIAGDSYSIAQRTALDLLERVGLAGKDKTAPALLSGGEQQRVAIARALFRRPAFLLADEPTAHLDEKTRGSILNLLLSCQKEWSMGLIIASHDPVVAHAMENTFELTNGQLKKLF